MTKPQHLDIATKIDGDSGSPVVLCHGTPFSSAVWDPVIPQLSSHHTVYRWDMPGYGASPLSGVVDLDTQAIRLVELISHWGIDNPSVVAHDIGGAVALRAHLFHGLELSSLTLIDTVCIPPWGSAFYKLAQDNAEVFTALPAPFHEALLLVYLDGVTKRELTATERNRLAEPWRGTGGQAAFYRQISQVRQTHTDDIVDHLGEVRCPVSVIWGSDDEWLPISNGQTLAHKLGVELIEISNAGHLVPYDQPELLSSALLTLTLVGH